MKIKILITIYMILFSSLCHSADDDYNLNLTQELDFSINGIINKRNFLGQDDERPNSIKYYKKWLKFWQDSLKVSGLHKIGPIEIEISDILSSKLFNIKRNDYIVNFNNSKIIFIDQIDGFYVKVSDDLDSEYHIRTKNNMDCSGLNIISNKRHFENYLNEKVNIDTLKQGEKNLENRLTDYFLINNDILIKQLSYHKTIINLNQNEHELKNQIRNLFSYQYLKTDLNKDAIIDNIIIGTNNCYKSHSFVAILLEGENEIYIKTHSHFEQVIKIDESYFLLLHHYKPSTGWCVYSLYKISENKLINIWQDSSLSM